MKTYTELSQLNTTATEFQFSNMPNAALLKFDVHSGSLDACYTNRLIPVNLVGQLEVCRISTRGYIEYRVTSGETYRANLNFSLLTSNSDVNWEKVITNNDLDDIYGLGTSISSSSDLNNYTNSGNYYSATGTITNSLYNIPEEVTTGFRLEVKNQTANSWLKQILYPNNNNQSFYIRQCDGGTWKEWNKISSIIDIKSDLLNNVSLKLKSDCLNVSDLTENRKFSITYFTTGSSNSPTNDCFGLLFSYRVDTNKVFLIYAITNYGIYYYWIDDDLATDNSKWIKI